MEFAESCNDVPLIVALKRSASPLKVDVPVNVAVPADAMNEPLTIRLFVIVKSTADVIDPVISRVPRFFVPAPNIHLDVPLIVSTPAPDVKLPLTDKLPVTLSGVVVLTVPDTVEILECYLLSANNSAGARHRHRASGNRDDRTSAGGRKISGHSNKTTRQIDEWRGNSQVVENSGCRVH